MAPPPDEDPRSQRAPWVSGPEPAAASGWLALDDDELLFRIERLPPEHGEDDALMEVVRSARHFFVRQEAAKRIRDQRPPQGPLRRPPHRTDPRARHDRREDAAYLESLVRESRHIEVKKAAEAQLSLLTDKGDER